MVGKLREVNDWEDSNNSRPTFELDHALELSQVQKRFLNLLESQSDILACDSLEETGSCCVLEQKVERHTACQVLLARCSQAPTVRL